MEKFNRTIRGYDPEEVNQFLDKVIFQVERIINESKEKDKKIEQLSQLEKENEELKEKLKHWERMEETLNKAIMMAQKTSDQMKLHAHEESEVLIRDAKRNANRIVSEALMKADKTEQEMNMLRRNMNIFKRKVRNIIEAQLEVVEELDEIEL